MFQMVFSFFSCMCFYCWGAPVASTFTKEYRTDDINNWYGTCWSSASFLMRSKIWCGMRIFITLSDLLNARYAAYSFNNASIFIMNNCCITFGIHNLLYGWQYCRTYN